MTKEVLKESVERILRTKYLKRLSEATELEILNSISDVIMEQLSDNWLRTTRAYKKVKQVHYLSIEYLIGRSFTNNLINLNMLDAVKDLLAEVNLSIDKIEEFEIDPGLGNGGLGRLAVCLLDSAATMNAPVYGYGLRYKDGLFTQKFCNGKQIELSEDWLRNGEIFQVRKDSEAKIVKFKDFSVKAVPYDIPITGYNTKNVNTIRLWQAEAINEFDFEKFNMTDYDDAIYDKNEAEKITRCLYPNDSVYEGKKLRLMQEYLLSSASIQDVLDKHYKKYGNFSFLNDYHAFQLNDTHTSLAIVEFIRILVHDYDYEISTAIEMAKQCFNFTNHTIMPEASEMWNIKLFEELFPEILTILEEINTQLVNELYSRGICPYLKNQIDTSIIVNDNINECPCPHHERLFSYTQEEYKIILNDTIKMQNLAIYMSKSVNGVSKVYTKILKEDALNRWYRLFPDKFNNKTNGVTPRRWLNESNKELAELITKELGDNKWITDLSRVNILSTRINDQNLLSSIENIKSIKKRQLAQHIFKKYGDNIDPNSLFEIQAKRIHEYKRQLLTCLYIIDLMNRLKNDNDLSIPKVTFIFAGKAYPTYKRAKSVVKLILAIRNKILNDEDLNGKINVYFLEDYNVSEAMKLVPAADVSLQISTIGTEASGTSNMKFMMNGAITIGTKDGANLEIFDAVGEDNYYSFGTDIKQMDEIKINYKSENYYKSDSGLNKAVNSLIDGTFGDDEDFKDLYKSLIDENDKYLVLKDFSSFREVQESVFKDYKTKIGWNKRRFNNIINSGKFSSDRTFKEYCVDIWNLNSIKIK